MNSHVLNVLGSATATILLGVLLVIFSNTVELGWQNVLIVTFILGYAHFIVGYIYQMRSVLRPTKPPRLKFAFFFLTILAGIFAFTLLLFNQITILAILVIPYFMVHEMFNEYSLSKQELGTVHPWVLFASSVGWFTALLLLAVRHNSFFYNNDLTYLRVPADFFLPYLAHVAPLWLFTAVPILMLVVSIPALVYGLVRLRLWKVGIPVLLTVCAGTVIALFFDPITYVYLFGFILSYHFIMWMVHFALRFYSTSHKELRNYIVLHAIIVVPLVCAVFFSGTLFDWTYNTFLNAETFVFITYIHVTVSFLNEPWLQRIMRINQSST